MVYFFSMDIGKIVANLKKKFPDKEIIIQKDNDSAEIIVAGMDI